MNSKMVKGIKMIGSLIFGLAESLGFTQTEKQESVIDVLNKDFNMPTKDVISEVLNTHSIDVSERYVQRIRKTLKEAKNYKGENIMLKGMDECQIQILNMANEGGWTVQEIAQNVTDLNNKYIIDANYVRETLKEFHYMVYEKVMDNESENVYFDVSPETGEVELPKEDWKVTGEVIELPTEKEEDKGYWEVELPERITACSKCKKEVDVFCSKKVRNKAMLFMKWAARREWLAYLIGEKDDKGYYIHDLYIPDQRTSATLVDDVMAHDYNNLKVVGVIHSHHEMGAGDEDNPSFSGHDREFINSNHNLSLLAGKDRKTGGFKVVGIARVITPCGGFMTIKAKVKSMKEEPSKEEVALKNEFSEKIFGKSNKGIKDGSKIKDKNGQYHFVSQGYLRKYLKENI